MIFKKLVLIGFISLTITKLLAQTGSIYTSAEYRYGSILAHHPEMKEYTSNKVNSFELNIGKQTTGKHDWEQLYHYPTYGLGYFYGDFNNPKVLGQAHAGFVYLDFHFIQRPSFFISAKYSLGASYFKTIFDSIENPINQAIGTNLNVYFSIGLKANIRLSKRFYLFAGGNFSHFSNGATQKPNLGINLTDASIGLQYYFNERTYHFEPKELTPCNKDYNLVVLFSAGSLQRTIESPHFFSSTFTINGTKQTGPKHSWGLGADFFYDESVKPELEDKNASTSLGNTLRQGLYISHDLIISRLSVITNLGAYTYYKTTPSQPIYFRIGLRCKVTKHLLANLSLKTHYGKADFIECGLGYSWK